MNGKLVIKSFHHEDTKNTKGRGEQEDAGFCIAFFSSSRFPFSFLLDVLIDQLCHLEHRHLFFAAQHWLQSLIGIDQAFVSGVLAGCDS